MNIETKEADALNAAFDESQLTFRDRASALASFKEDHEIITAEDGTLFTRYDSVLMPLGDALRAFGADNRQHIDGRSLPRYGAVTTHPDVSSKADLKSVDAKVAFITQHGQEAFEKLPLTEPITGELTTFAQWLKLPVAERVRLTAIDPDIVAKLAPTVPNQKDGATVAEKIRALNPNARTPGWSRAANR